MAEFFREFEVVDSSKQYAFREVEVNQCFVAELKNRPYLRRRACEVGSAYGMKFSVLTEGDKVYVCRRK